MIQKFCNILLVCAILQRVYHVSQAVEAVKAIRWDWYNHGSWGADMSGISSLCDLKVAQMNIRLRLNREVMLYEFEPDPNAEEATKNIYCAKAEGAFDHDTVTRYEVPSIRFQTFCIGI